MAVTSSPSSTVASSRWALGDPALEWLKWIAVAAMLLDHVNWFLFAGGGDPQGTGYAWMNDVGRIAFPLFALCFGVNLSRVLDGPEREARLARMLGRLFVAGIVAQVAYWVLRGYFLPINVLGTFAVAVVVAVVWRGGGASFARRALSVAVFMVAGALVEYSWIGVGLALAGMAIRHVPLPLSALPFASLLVPLCFLNGNPYALGALALAVALGGIRWAPPRVPGLLHVVYAGHLWVLVVIAAMLGRLV